MNAHITYSDRMELTATNTEGVVFKTNFEGRCIELEEALQAANDLFEYEDINHIHILSATTGEILAICEPDDEQINEEERFDEYMDECGFDPYMGCYTEDC